MTDNEASYSMKPIGWVRTDFQQKFGTPRQATLAASSRARVELAKEYRGRGILSGLEGFSHVWILSYFHLSEFKKRSVKVKPPRLDGAKVGILGSRSPDRPNNIGLTLSRILSCDGDHLELAEIDLVDGTPILDLKPYLAEADRPQEYASGWTTNVRKRELPCVFSEKADEDMKDLAVPSRVRTLIEEMLKLDPRSPAYLNRENAQFAVWVAGLNVKFTFDSQQFIVTAVERS